MSTLLHIKSSIFSDGGKSNELAEVFISQWEKANTGGQVIIRDLVGEPIPHLDAEVVGAFMSPAESHNEVQRKIIEISDALIKELSEADEIVIGVPMYNFSIPSQLKAYFDQLARAGVTFKYTETGPVGLLDDKPVTVITTRGGFYKDGGKDNLMPLVIQFFNFMGLTKIETVYAEGLAVPDKVEEALTLAKRQIENI